MLLFSISLISTYFPLIHLVSCAMIKIYLDDTIEKLAYIDGKSDWIDLRSAVDVELKAGEFKLIHLGIAMKLPEGYEAHVVPRSSTYKNFGIIQTNHCGIIDSPTAVQMITGICLPMPAYTVIHKNDRILPVPY